VGQKTYTPNFYLTINGYDVTKLCISWQLDDVEDGISTLTANIGNPDGLLSGYLRTETDITLRYGYWDGKMSKPVTMKIKDKKESFHTSSPSTITVVGMDCTERLTGITNAGNSKEKTSIVEAIESHVKGIKAKPEVNVENPEKMPDKIPIHNMTSHAGVRWLMGMTKCKGGGGGGGGETPIRGQKDGNAGDKFESAESVTGDRAYTAEIQGQLKPVDDAFLNNNAKKAGNSTIYGSLQCIGIPGLEAKKCVTVTNVGEEGSGKWYVKKSSQKWHVNSGYYTICDLMRPTLGKDGKPIEQPVIMYAKIYEKDTVVVECRKVDGESQYTFVFGQPEEDAEELLVDFTWGIRLQRGRGAGERTKQKNLAANEAKKLKKSESKEEGSYSPQSSAPPNLGEYDTAVG
jgi:hypothetical protein